MSRYLAVRRRDDVDWYDGFQVVDLDEARVIVSATSQADAELIADALNGEPAHGLAVAKRALVDIHTFIAAELDKNTDSRWSDYYTDKDRQRLVAQLQREYEEPF